MIIKKISNSINAGSKKDKDSCAVSKNLVLGVALFAFFVV
jgi:hypothetical protein